MAEPVRRVVSWNTKVGRGDHEIAEALKALIDDLDPDVICLQECKGYTDMLRREFGVGNGGRWRIYFHTDWEESNSNPVMIQGKYGENDRGTPNGWDTLRTHTVWYGPDGGKHHGRTWTWVKVGGIYIMSLHRVTKMKDQNSAAGKEEAEKLTRWITNRDDGVLIVGDHNIGPKKGEPNWSSKSIAQQADGAVDFDIDNPGIDYALKKGVKITDTQRKKSYGSDHKALLVTLPEG